MSPELQAHAQQMRELDKAFTPALRDSRTSLRDGEGGPGFCHVTPRVPVDNLLPPDPAYARGQLSSSHVILRVYVDSPPLAEAALHACPLAQLFRHLCGITVHVRNRDSCRKMQEGSGHGVSLLSCPRSPSGSSKTRGRCIGNQLDGPSRGTQRRPGAFPRPLRTVPPAPFLPRGPGFQQPGCGHRWENTSP